jgi:hypothetical protein
MELGRIGKVMWQIGLFYSYIAHSLTLSLLKKSLFYDFL